ncbi:HAD family phosphatase [Candidatus Saccharibacteria bacterium]|jgi:HAD superfamily hydrolase (TIGR01509 family)|nr:HAD family phosphatase [Candidatus Saccharibacteria bacterium]
MANKKILKFVNIELTDHDIKKMMTFGYGIEDILRVHEFSNKDIRKIHQRRIDLYQSLLLSENYAIPGAEEVVVQIAKNYSMAIVTNSPSRDFDVIHKNTSFLQYMDFVLTREDYKKSKPDPEPYLLALSRFDIQPEQAVVIEDSARGFRSAQAANIDCIILRNEFTRDQDFEGASAYADSHAELPEIIASL